MFYFLKDMNTQAGKVYKAGGVVPENFSTPDGIAEMIAAGDIIEVDPEPAMSKPEAFEEPEPFEEEEVVKPIKKEEEGGKMSANGTMQAATVIAKTTQTAVGSILGTDVYEYLNLFVTYIKGDETGVDIIVSFQRTDTGTAHPESTWTDSGGVNTRAAKKYRLTASANAVIPILLEGIDYVLVTQGGSNNDGTPTGTLAVSYSMA